MINLLILKEFKTDHFVYYISNFIIELINKIKNFINFFF